MKEMKKVAAWGSEEPSRFTTTVGWSMTCCSDWNREEESVVPMNTLKTMK